MGAMDSWNFIVSGWPVIIGIFVIAGGVIGIIAKREVNKKLFKETTGDLIYQKVEDCASKRIECQIAFGKKIDDTKRAVIEKLESMVETMKKVDDEKTKYLEMMNRQRDLSKDELSSKVKDLSNSIGCLRSEFSRLSGEFSQFQKDLKDMKKNGTNGNVK